MNLAKRLINIGIKEDDHVAVIGRNRPYLYWSLLAIQHIGAVPVPLYQDAVAEEMEYVLAHCGAKFVIAGDQEQVDKILEIEAKLPDFKQMIYLDGRGLRKYDHSKLHSFVSIMENGKNSGPAFKSTLNEREGALTYDSTCVMLYTSGTTGKPKAIVHGTGSMILEHQKALAIHQNVCEGDRYFWYSTTGWMMWNYALSSLLCGATLCLYNGAPTTPKPSVLWDFASQAKINHFGHGAVYFQQQADEGLSETEGYDFHHLKTIGSTGSPLSADTCKSLQHRFPNTHIISLSGGTDVCTAFVGGHPEMEVVPGEIQCKMLGAAVDGTLPNLNQICVIS